MLQILAHRFSVHALTPSLLSLLQDISLFYQIFPEELLGSGQFGTVYGGKRQPTSCERLVFSVVAGSRCMRAQTLVYDRQEAGWVLD